MTLPEAEICGDRALCSEATFPFSSAARALRSLGARFSFPGQGQLLALSRTGLAFGDDVWHLSVLPG